MNNKAFLTMKAPANYVAGIGRGASGFTTRSDIGPMKSEAEIAQATAQAQARAKRNRDTEDDGYMDESKFDSFEGYGETLVNRNAVYDEDDEEADRIFQAVDEHMENRRKKRREAREEEEREKFRLLNPKISHTFADLKRDLANVSEDEWNSIPEIGDYSLTLKYQESDRKAKYSKVPESLLEKAIKEKEHFSTLDASQQSSSASTSQDLTQIGDARNQYGK
eukprot:TRINITY_DN6139_c0_g2_i4.p1 TRINITY_DN6139_c0_g2~~TRINITY_DN6139_c0_g2_i4.p1  ORF type:complete len:238 (+),score=66.91 TRINITY_DN6139_c0_g2_i4:50-715(+)